MAENNSKSRYFWAVMYPENMKENWKEEIDSLLEIPFAYCIHDKCMDKEGNKRKEHLHLILAFKNTTTYNHAMSVFQELNAEGKQAINNCKRIINIRRAYNYLIHDTDDCRRKGKYIYSDSERIIGNNFDIGSYEQLTLDDIEKILDRFAGDIIQNNFLNYRDFWIYITSKEDTTTELRSIARKYHGFLEALTRGNYLAEKMKLS